MNAFLKVHRVKPGSDLEPLVEENDAIDDAIFGVHVTEAVVLDEEPSVDPTTAEDVVAEVAVTGGKRIRRNEICWLGSVGWVTVRKICS